MMFCRIVVGQPILASRAGICWLLRHGASHDLPDEDAVVSRWWFFVGHVMAPRHFLSAFSTVCVRLSTISIMSHVISRGSVEKVKRSIIVKKKR